MKNRSGCAVIAVVAAGLLAGCSGELSNEYVTVTQYKDLEVPQATSAVEEVTDEQVDQMIEGTLSAYAVREDVLRQKTGGIFHPVFYPFCAFAGVGSRRLRLIATTRSAWFCGYLAGKDICDRGCGGNVISDHLDCRLVENGTAIVTNVMSYQIKKMIR